MTETLPVESSGVKRGRNVTFDEILEHFDKPMVLRENAVTIVGGLTNRKETEGDFDFYIDLDFPPNFTLSDLVKWRIQRSFEDKKDADRIQFVSDENPSPVFTNHCHIYQLQLTPIEHEIHEMSKIELWKVKPFTDITPWKSIKAGYRTAEFFDIEEAVEAVSYLLPGIYVQPKLDGNRIFLHYHKGESKIITEDGHDITEKLPKVCDDMELQKVDSFIYDTELIGLKGGKHLTRSQVAGYLHQKEPLGDKEDWMIAVAHDLLHLNGKSLVDLGYEERYNSLKKALKPKKHISLMPSKIADTVDELRSAIKWSFSY